MWTENDALRHAETTLRQVERLGIRLHPDNRIVRAQRSIRELKDQGSSVETADTVRFTRYAEAHRTILETFVIVSALDDDVTDALKDKLACLGKGHDDPAADANSTARDTQFELVVAAVLRLAGFSHVIMAEPDIRIEGPAGPFGVAVKRLRSGRQWQARVSHACHQLCGQGLHGILAFNLDRHVRDVSTTGSASAESEWLAEAVASLVTMVRQPDAGPHVLAVLGFATVFEWITHDGDSVATMRIRFIFNINWLAPTAIRRSVERTSMNLAHRITVALGRLLALV